MYNRGWMRERITSYLKDKSVSAELDTWIDLSAKRVSSLLECFEMETIVSNSLQIGTGGTVNGGSAGASTVTVLDGGDAFNADPASAPKNYLEFSGLYKRLVVVQVQDNGVWRPLRSIPKHEAANYRHSGIPTVYTVENRQIYPLPFVDAQYRAIFLAEVEIPTTLDDEVDALTAYPYLFLNAALAEAYDWKQDEVMNARYEQKWQSEAEQIKILYRSEHVGETPSMRAM